MSDKKKTDIQVKTQKYQSFSIFILVSPGEREYPSEGMGT